MAVIYIFASDGTCLEKRGGALTPGLESAYKAKFGQDIYLTEWPEDPHPDHYDTNDFTAEFEGGEVVGITVPDGPDEMFLHTIITAPGSGPTGVPSVAADETATVNASLRAGVDPESAVIPYTGTVRAPYYMNGAYHGELRMIFAAGVCAYTFEPKSHHHGTLTINEDEIGLLQEKKIRLVGEAKLIVDEKSAA